MLILLNVGREVYHTGLPCNILCKSLLKGFRPASGAFRTENGAKQGAEAEFG